MYARRTASPPQCGARPRYGGDGVSISPIRATSPEDTRLRTCDSCGFENAEPDKPCPLCGASEIRNATLASDVPTVEFPAGRSPAAFHEAGARTVSGVGVVYGDRYRVVGDLGHGGMGQVYRVHDEVEKRDLALKVLRPGGSEDPERIERFRREIGVLSKLSHPAVPRIHGWGLRGDTLYFVSDLVDGADLKAEIQRRGPWPAAEAAALAATVADALAAAHAQGIVHRDVKPNNIMIGKDGSVRLLDFGLARGVGIDMATLTRTGTIVGTPGYMSPEQFEGQGVDERTDIYSLGVVLFEMVTARLPFTGQTPLAVAMKHKTEPPPPPRSIRRDVPAWMERVVFKCLEKDPARRFLSAAELGAELRRTRTGRPQMRPLPSGDSVVEDDSETSDWALVLRSPAEKAGWSAGLALRFGDRYFRLVETASPDGVRFEYRFVFWPEGEVFRRIVDYEQDCTQRQAAREQTLSAKLSRWITGRKE